MVPILGHVIWLFVALGALLIFAIAAALVGNETFRLAHTPTTAIFDMDEAVEAVGDRLDDSFTAVLTYDEVRKLIVFAMQHFEAKGLSIAPGQDPALADTPDVTIADDDAVAVVLGRADAIGLEVTDATVLAVLDCLLAHLAAIGAVGPQAA